MMRRASRKYQLLLLMSIATFASLNLVSPVLVKGKAIISESSEQTNPRIVEAEQLNQQVVELWNQGKYQVAIPLAEKALFLRKEVFGNNHSKVATSLHNLGYLYKEQGKFKKAAPFLLQALEIDKKQLGEDHLLVAESLNNLAELYRKQGKFKKAEPLYLQAIEIYKQELGENHPFIILSLEILDKELRKDKEVEPLNIQENCQISRIQQEIIAIAIHELERSEFSRSKILWCHQKK